jgi:excinuclease ABC subunit C
MKRTATDEAPAPRLFPAAPFTGFGPSLFRPALESITGRRIKGESPSKLLRGVRDHAPRQPGVYGMTDARGKLIYIGKAKNLRGRLLSYFRENSRDPKAGKIIERTRALSWEQTGDELAALLRELELIQRVRPRFNVIGLPGLSRHHYVCVGKGPAPFAFVSKNPTGKEAACYGPLTAVYRSEDAVRRLNDWFKLRDCPNTVPMAFADQADLFPLERAPKCLRFEIGNCSGPCVGSCTRTQYGANVRALRAFLDGRDRALLASIEAAMAEAAERFEFERAAAMRDRLKSLQWLDDRLALLRRARTMNSFVYPLTGADGVERWYLIHRGQVRGVLAPPAEEADRLQAAETIRTVFAEQPGSAILGPGTVDSVLLVVAWFRKNTGEKKKLVARETILERLSTT